MKEEKNGAVLGFIDAKEIEKLAPAANITGRALWAKYCCNRSKSHLYVTKN